MDIKRSFLVAFAAFSVLRTTLASVAVKEEWSEDVRCREHQWESDCVEEAHNPPLTNCYELDCWCEEKHCGFMSAGGGGR